MRRFVLASLPFAMLLLSGCLEPRQSIEFHLSDNRPEYELSYFPIVERDGRICYGEALHKTADASGYHEADVNAKYPDALSAPWRSNGFSSHDRLGIVILERDEEHRELLESAKVFWLNIPEDQIDDREIHVKIPELNTLQEFDVSVVLDDH